MLSRGVRGKPLPVFNHYEVTPVVRFRLVNRNRPRSNQRQRHHQWDPWQEQKLLPSPLPEQKSQHRQRWNRECDKSLCQKGKRGEDAAEDQQQNLSAVEVRLHRRQIGGHQNSGDESGRLAVEHGKCADSVNQSAGEVKDGRKGRKLTVAQRLIDQNPDQQRRQPGAERSGKTNREGVVSEDFETSRRQPVSEHWLLKIAHVEQPGSDIIAVCNHLAGNLRITELVRRHQRPSGQRYQIRHDKKQYDKPKISHFHSSGLFG